MEIFISIAVTILVFFLLHRIGNNDGEKNNIVPESKENIKRDRGEQTQEECIELCMKVLRSMNCKVERDKEATNKLDFKYQGGNFSIFCGSKLIEIWFMFWYEIDLDDIDRLAKARRIINDLNLDCPTPCVSYVINDELQKMYIHSSAGTVFINEIPALDDLMGSYFDRFFEKANKFTMRMATEEKAE